MQHETAKSVWQTYKMAEIGEQKEEHRRLFENWLKKHKDSKKYLVITDEECKEIKQPLNGTCIKTKQCQHLITAIESEA